MAAPIRASSNKYVKEGQVDIDGQIWNVKLPGSRTEMRMAQLQREAKANEARIASLEKLIDKGEATDDQIDRYEELCEKSQALTAEGQAVFLQVFSDGTKDNDSVRKWVDETPTVIQHMVFDDVKKGGDAKNVSTGEATV